MLPTSQDRFHTDGQTGSVDDLRIAGAIIYFWLCVWSISLDEIRTCANLNLMRLDSVRNGVSDAHANVCRRPCAHCRGKFCARSQSSIRSIWRLRWKIVFDRSRFPVTSVAATVGFPISSLTPLFVLASTSIWFWGSVDWTAWPLLRRVGRYESVLSIFICLS
jgi:hypothetical protein